MNYTYKIGNDEWRIVEWNDVEGPARYWVYKNGLKYDCCAGSEYETESGACFAILNEYAK